ncbi:MAG: hypothetical protein P0116_07955 [Candidatus Nitrosocosmicus sp.]|nr:hypothetical protein [Candidatus Nitrosocosmicus sp.]
MATVGDNVVIVMVGMEKSDQHNKNDIPITMMTIPGGRLSHSWDKHR